MRRRLSFPPHGRARARPPGRGLLERAPRSRPTAARPTAAEHPGATALHDLHLQPTPSTGPSATNDFYRLPFPNLLHMAADGTLDLASYPRQDDLITSYVDTFASGTHGAGTNSAIYFRFDAAIDETTLPADGHAALDLAATAFVVDITPGSPTYGQSAPVRSHFVATTYDFIGPFWMALLPVAGFPLRPATTYAAVLTDGIRAKDGGPIHRSADLDAALASGTSSDPRVAAAQTAYRPALAWLAAKRADLTAHVVNLTVFTTVDPTSVMAKLRSAVYAQAPEPALAGLVYDGEDRVGLDQIYEGTYVGPNFQTGDPPYGQTGGTLLFDSSGTPQVQRMENLRVAMTIPEGTMPASGWPVVLYAHGTGGDYKTFIDDGSAADVAKVTDAGGATIAQMAMISIDQVLHGPRAPAGTNVEVAFFNFANLGAARDNVKQGGLDDFQLLRLVKAIDVAAAPSTSAPIRFDPDRIYFKGHSQGGLTGPLFLSAEPEVKASVLSGAGGNIVLSLLNKTEPVNIPGLLEALLRDPIDEFHPLLNLLQGFFEDSDPIQLRAALLPRAAHRLRAEEHLSVARDCRPLRADPGD